MDKINQQLIADTLNISRSTVSRCFTNHPAINPETRSRVFKLAAQMGYVHMETRTRDRKQAGRQVTIGVLICTSLDDYFDPRLESPGQNLMAGVSEFALLEDVRLDLHYVDPRARSLAELPFFSKAPQRARKWAGVLLIYPFPEPVIRELQLRFPVISLVEQSGQTELNCVDVDHYKGIAMAVDRLVQAGHRRLGFLSRPYEIQSGWAFRRYSAFMEKMARLGMKVEGKDIVNVSEPTFHDLEKSYDYVAQRIHKGVTGWVCAADYIGYDLVAGLQKRGFAVPQSVSVTGFDGLKNPPGLPLLSTAVVPYREIGLIGGNQLMRLVSKPFSSIQHVLIEAGFREGGTIAPPAA